MSKETPILMSTPMIQAIIGGRKTMTRRILTKNNSKCGTLLTGDGQGWHSFDFNDVVIDGKKSDYWYLKVAVPEDDTRHRIFCKREVGDVLLVRESFRVSSWYPDDGEICFSFLTDDDYETPCICFDDAEVFNRYWVQSCDDLYKAGYAPSNEERFEDYKNSDLRVRPSIFMPKEAARIWLEITNIRVERVKEISRVDAAKEGVCFPKGSVLPKWCHRHRFPEENFLSLWETINGNHKLNEWVWVIEFKVLSLNGRTKTNDGGYTYKIYHAENL